MVRTHSKVCAAHKPRRSLRLSTFLSMSSITFLRWSNFACPGVQPACPFACVIAHQLFFKLSALRTNLSIILGKCFCLLLAHTELDSLFLDDAIEPSLLGLINCRPVNLSGSKWTLEKNTHQPVTQDSEQAQRSKSDSGVDVCHSVTGLRSSSHLQR